MAVRVNSILTPSEEMAELKKAIEGEKEYRKSLRISASPDYYSTQKEYLEKQIAEFQAKLKFLKDKFLSAEEEIEASKVRQSKLRKRYVKLKYRDKFDRIEKLKSAIAEIEKTTTLPTDGIDE